MGVSDAHQQEVHHGLGHFDCNSLLPHGRHFARRAAGERLCQRGPQPQLADAKVLTMETVGEFLGLDQDKHLFLYFCRHYGHFFPALCSVHRTTFARQAANLWKVKE